MDFNDYVPVLVNLNKCNTIKRIMDFDQIVLRGSLRLRTTKLHSAKLQAL